MTANGCAWVKTKGTPGEHQNRWQLDVHPPHFGSHRLYPMARRQFPSALESGCCPKCRDAARAGIQVPGAPMHFAGGQRAQRPEIRMCYEWPREVFVWPRLLQPKRTPGLLRGQTGTFDSTMLLHTRMLLKLNTHCRVMGIATLWAWPHGPAATTAQPSCTSPKASQTKKQQS